MRKAILAVVAALAAPAALAQTTNVNCTNDYYFRQLGLRFPALGTPCNAAVYTVMTGTAVEMRVDTGFGPGSLVTQIFAIGACVPAAFCFPSVPCGLPNGITCGTNQSLDLDILSLFPAFSAPTISGVCQSYYRTTFVFPPVLVGLVLSTQSIIWPIGPHCALPAGGVFTEAFTIRFV